MTTSPTTSAPHSTVATATDAPGWPDDVAARYRDAGHWAGRTLSQELAATAARRPEHTAVVVGDHRLTFAELQDRSLDVAHGLRALGLDPGDRVVVQLPNTVDLLPALYGVLHAGLVPVVALAAHRAVELTAFVTQTGARAYLCVDTHQGHDFRPLAAELGREHPDLRTVVAGELADGLTTTLDDVAARGRTDRATDPTALPGAERRTPSDVALLQISGGTTGVPKLIPRTHDDYLCTARGCAQACELTADDVYLAALPATHNFPLVSPGVIGAHAAGATVVLAPAPSPDVCLDLVAREGVTLTSLVPPVLLAWLASPGARERLATLRLVQVGGAKCSVEVARRVRPELDVELQQMFGMAEGLICCTRPGDPDDVVVGTQGRPINPDDEVRVVDDADQDVPDGTPGHLLARGPYTIRGYYRAPEVQGSSFTPDGWYRTGDVVVRRADGNLVVEGRAKDQINRGGEKIAPEEVENALLAHPGVHDAVLVAEADAYLGESTCAFVVRAPGRGPIGDDAPLTDLELARALRKHVRARGLAAYKVPDRVVVVDALPTVGVGKNSKRELRRSLAGQILASADDATPSTSTSTSTPTSTDTGAPR